MLMDALSSILTYVMRSVFKLTSNIESLSFSDAFQTAVEEILCGSNDSVIQLYIRDCSETAECFPASKENGGEQFNRGTCMCDDNFSGPACATPVTPTAQTASMTS